MSRLRPEARININPYFQPLNISWTTVTEPALAASPTADQLQTRETVLPGYFFPTARLPR